MDAQEFKKSLKTPEKIKKERTEELEKIIKVFERRIKELYVLLNIANPKRKEFVRQSIKLNEKLLDEANSMFWKEINL